ncbi:MAG TPA: hypothetical protein VFE10_15130 [Phenylobacterium sp.]|jgi:hypothetical protein|nr:hypothetical protein [Phenylobacterium sp.]
MAASDDATFAPRWLVAVGGRAFDFHTHTTSEVVSERFSPRSLDREKSFRGIAPKISVQRASGAGNLIYAVMSQGMRTGGVNSGGAAPLPPQQETFAPDRLTNLEESLKLRFWDDRVALKFAVSTTCGRTSRPTSTERRAFPSPPTPAMPTFWAWRRRRRSRSPKTFRRSSTAPGWRRHTSARASSCKLIPL